MESAEFDQGRPAEHPGEGPIQAGCSHLVSERQCLLPPGVDSRAQRQKTCRSMPLLGDITRASALLDLDNLLRGLSVLLSILLVGPWAKKVITKQQPRTIPVNLTMPLRRFISQVFAIYITLGI